MEKNNDYIDLMDYVKRLWTSKSFIIKVSVLGAIIGLVVGFSLPKTYRASVVLAPETEQKMGSGVSSIASMMGVSLDNSVDAISVEMFPDVVASTPFAFELFDLPVTFVRKDSTMTTTLLDYMLYHQKSPWWSYILQAPIKLYVKIKTAGKEVLPRPTIDELDPQNLPYDDRQVISYLRENISVVVDKKTRMTKISVYMQDPLVASTVVDAVKDNLAEYMTNYRTSKIRQDIDNLTIIYNQRKEEYYAAQNAYATYADANMNVILHSAQAERQRLQQDMNLAYQVFSQISSQLEAARIKELEAKPVFAILEPVSIPIRKSAPSKAKLLIVFTFLGFCSSAAWVLFGKDFWKKLKQTLRK